MTNHPHSPEFSGTPTYHKASGYLGVTYRTDVRSAIDWLGNRFAVGDLVIYCIGAGRSQLMALGTVQQIRAHEYDVFEYIKPDGTRGWGEDAVRTKTGTRWMVEVQVLTEKSSGAWNHQKRTRPAWVNPINITALPMGIPNSEKRELLLREASR